MGNMIKSTPIKNIKFQKYRGFYEEQTLELKPITLLFGRNSVGKSASLRLLPILSAASRKRRGNKSVLDYSAPALRGANFGDIISNGQISSAMTFSIEWPDLSYQFSIRNIDESTEIVTNFCLKNPISCFSGEVSVASNPKAAAPDYSSFDIAYDGENRFDIWKLEGIRPSIAEGTEENQTAKQLRESLDAFGESVFWLEAIRSSVPRFFELTLGSDGSISSDGSGVAQALRQSSMVGDGISEAVSAWLEKTCNCMLSSSASSSVAVFNRQVFPFNVTLKSGAQIAVKDIGEGIAQALPVVTICHQARLGKLGPHPILAFEQPELHLHPTATVQLADEIISCVVSNSEARHVIETHAESMLLAVQIAIVEKRIKPSDAIVYWVNNDDAGTHLRPITFDDEGFPIGGWPQGVFRETLDQSRRLSELRIETGVN
ncbi:putative ATPase [Methylorubrum rhodesianum]|uniref:AAA family ATPase n=1 Tax=Methylorubrum TaxID=2282523 RepID=UPI00160AA1ED|nr:MULTISPECIES: AAA family ATPase [Methylorubrum]MBB5761396.1 putative ATPase [Methylorubrum rhodesianum]